ncbi:hypothetical protein D3C75_1162220 [compost metagenome]
MDRFKCAATIRVVAAMMLCGSLAFATALPMASSTASRWVMNTVDVVSVTVSSMPTTLPNWSRMGL